MPSVLVTGGAGFIGSHLVDHLLENGWSVTAVDNFDPFYSTEIKRRNIQSHRTWDRYRLVEADIRDTAKLRASLSGDYDLIVHLAARAGVRPSIENPVEYQSVNVSGTQNLLELARLWKTPRFVFASSSSVYGVNPNVPWREDDLQLMPISPYAASKISGEAIGRVYSHLFGLRFVALRFFTVYGPRQRPDLAIHSFASRIVNRKPITLYGNGQTSRDYTFIDDIVRGIRGAMRYDGALFDVFNLGNCRTVTLRDLVEGIEEATGVRAIVQYAAEQMGDVPRTCADIGKAKRLLGYHPATELRQGLERFVADFLPRTTYAEVKVPA